MRLLHLMIVGAAERRLLHWISLFGHNYRHWIWSRQSNPSRIVSIIFFSRDPPVNIFHHILEPFFWTLFCSVSCRMHSFFPQWSLMKDDFCVAKTPSLRSFDSRPCSYSYPRFLFLAPIGWLLHKTLYDKHLDRAKYKFMLQLSTFSQLPLTNVSCCEWLFSFFLSSLFYFIWCLFFVFHE